MKSKMLYILFLAGFLAGSLSAASTEIIQGSTSPVMKPVAHNVLHLLPASIVCARDLSDVSIIHIEDSFFALREGKLTKIQNYNLDQELRGLSQDDVKNFLEQGYVQLTQSSNGDYNLRAQGRLLGGGIIGGKIAYWVTKTLCWAIVGTAATAGTGFVVSHAAPVVATKVGLSAATTAKVVGGAKALSSAGTGIIGVSGTTAKVIAGAAATDAALVGAATEAVTTYAATAGGLSGLAASIEGLSIAVGGFFGFVSGPV